MTWYFNWNPSRPGCWLSNSSGEFMDNKSDFVSELIGLGLGGGLGINTDYVLGTRWPKNCGHSDYDTTCICL
jgi:hypothetical protein